VGYWLFGLGTRGKQRLDLALGLLLSALEPVIRGHGTRRAGKLPSKMRCVIITIIISGALIGSIVYLLHSQSRRGVAQVSFHSSEEVSSEIGELPLVSDKPRISPEEADAYIRMAKRLRLTNASFIRDGLRTALSNNNRDPFVNMKVMILLRVAFQCPASEGPTGFSGGWLSGPDNDLGTKRRDANWPVQRTINSFILSEVLGGYLGPPYDGVADFDWRLIHCSWRRW
jgi:hypothetical protein